MNNSKNRMARNKDKLKELEQDATIHPVVTHINEYPPEYLEKYADYYSNNEKDIFFKVNI